MHKSPALSLSFGGDEGKVELYYPQLILTSMNESWLQAVPLVTSTSSMAVRFLLLSEMEAFMIMEYVDSEEVSRKLVEEWLRRYMY